MVQKMQTKAKTTISTLWAPPQHYSHDLITDCDECTWGDHDLESLSLTVNQTHLSLIGYISLGDYSWGLGAETPGVTLAPVVPTTPTPLPRSEDEDDVEDMEEDIQVTVAHLAEVFSALRSVLTPVFFRGVFAFLTWWVVACQLISSLFGIYFHQYLMQSWAEQHPLCAGCVHYKKLTKLLRRTFELHPSTTGRVSASEGLILTGDRNVFGLRQRDCWSIDCEAFLLKHVNLFATQDLKWNLARAEGMLLYDKTVEFLQIESLNNFEELVLLSNS